MRINAIDCGANYAPNKLRVSKKSSEYGVLPQRECNTISFKKKIDIAKIQNDLSYNYFIDSRFNNNPLIADCTHKITKVFTELFGYTALPESVVVEPMVKGSLGCFTAGEREVSFNSDASRFKSKWRLNIASKLDWNPIFPNHKSTLHPAHVFAHEYGHAAHWDHIVGRHGENMAFNYWMGLSGTTVPSAVGRLIIRYKLGNYAVDSMDMSEFVAERVAKDVCKSLSWRNWNIKEKPDIKYEDIFERKWEYRYTSPQSYLDYFTQQIWNGDREGALKVADDIEEFLKSVEQKTSVKKEEIDELRERIKEDRTVMKKTADAYNSQITKLADIKSREVHPVAEKVDKVVSEVLNQRARVEVEPEIAEEEIYEKPLFTPLSGMNVLLTRKLNKRNEINLNPELTLRL